MSARTLALALALIAAPTTALAADPPPKPCAAAEHRQFDFWIGDWDVFTKDGKKVGENRIENTLGGCVLMENWRSSSGKSVGHSFNIFRAGKWHQTWVDNQGLLLELVGGLDAKGRMVMSQDTVDAAGKPLRHRLTWTKLDDGRVQQHWQSSSDGGKTYKDAFLGIYTKKKKTKR